MKVVVVVEVVDVRFLLPFGLPRDLNVIMKDEAKGWGGGSDGSEATASLSFVYSFAWHPAQLLPLQSKLEH